MQTLRDFQIFFQGKLSKELDSLEADRVQFIKKIIFVAVSQAVLLIILFYHLQSVSKISAYALAFLGIILFGGLYSVFTRSFSKRYFKDLVVRSVLRFIDDDFSYVQGNYVSSVEFLQSDLFVRYPDEYGGSDYVKGKIGTANVAFSEIQANYFIRFPQKGDKKTLFNGLFFVGQLNHQFKGKTVIFPDVYPNLLETNTTFLNPFWARGEFERVEVEDKCFNAFFSVYSNDVDEANSVLSDSILQSLGNFQNRFNRTIYLSFVDSKVYIAISTDKKFLEASVVRPQSYAMQVMEYFENLSLALKIVEEVNLNFHVWSRR